MLSVPDELEYLWRFPLPLLHPILHGGDDVVCLVFGAVLAALLSRAWG